MILSYGCQSQHWWLTESLMRCNSSGVNACGGDICGGESVHWLLGYWLELEERSLALTRLPALDLTLAAGEGAPHPPSSSFCWCSCPEVTSRNDTFHQLWEWGDLITLWVEARDIPRRRHAASNTLPLKLLNIKIRTLKIISWDGGI